MDPPHLPLLFTVAPQPDETLVGFLLRLSEANRLGSPQTLLAFLTGRNSQPPSWRHLVTLAEACSLPLGDLSHLFGFVSRNCDGETIWRIGSEWVSKPYFVSSRKLSYCPLCLAQSPYLRSVWELTLYHACARHRILLESVCPRCGRSTSWLRPSVALCTCGANLTLAIPREADEMTLAVSMLIEQKVHPEVVMALPHVLPQEILRRLQTLTLDGLCKTLWLFGSMLEPRSGKGRHQAPQPLKQFASLALIEKAGDILRTWPAGFHEGLDHLLANRPLPAHDGTLVHRMFGGAHRFLSEDMRGAEFLFIRLAYERYVRNLWRTLGKPSVPISVSRQLELELLPDVP